MSYPIKFLDRNSTKSRKGNKTNFQNDEKMKISPKTQNKKVFETFQRRNEKRAISTKKFLK